MGALVCTKRTITIEVSESNGFNVIENGRSTGGLTWEEMLAQITTMTINPRLAKPGGMYRMEAPAVWAEESRRRQERYQNFCYEVPL